jgi:hypothetical protein
VEDELSSLGAIPLSIPTNVLKGLGPRKFVRSGALAANLDLKTYDVGQLVVATQGMADTTSVGELYVEYEVELCTPILSTKQLASISSKTFTGVSPSSTSYLGATPTFTGGLDASGTGNTLTFNRVGFYLLEMAITGTGLNTAFTPVNSGTVSGVVTTINLSNFNGTVAAYGITFQVTARGQTLILDCSGQATTISTSVTRISGFVPAFP